MVSARFPWLRVPKSRCPVPCAFGWQGATKGHSLQLLSAPQRRSRVVEKKPVIPNLAIPIANLSLSSGCPWSHRFLTLTPHLILVFEGRHGLSVHKGQTHFPHAPSKPAPRAVSWFRAKRTESADRAADSAGFAAALGGAAARPGRAPLGQKIHMGNFTLTQNKVKTPKGEDTQQAVSGWSIC